MDINKYYNKYTTNEAYIFEASNFEYSIQGEQAKQYAESKGIEVGPTPFKEGKGPIEKKLIDALAEASRLTGITFHITSAQRPQNKASYHKEGRAIDVISSVFGSKHSNNKSHVDAQTKFEKVWVDLMLSGKYDTPDHRLGGINEYTWGPNPAHYHLSLSTLDPSKDGYECIFPRVGVNSYHKIRQMKSEGKTSIYGTSIQGGGQNAPAPDLEPGMVSGTQGGMDKAPKQTSTASKTPIYYKVFDREEKRSLVLKYSPAFPNEFKIMDKKKRKNLGKLERRGNTIIMTRYDKEFDITEKRLGRIANMLFDRALSQGTVKINVEPQSDDKNVDITTNKPTITDDQSEIVIKQMEKSHKNIPGSKIRINRDFRRKNDIKKKNIKILEDEMAMEGWTSPHALIGLLCVIGKESNFIPRNEIMNYSPGRLAEVWGKFSKTGKKVPKGKGQYNYNQAAVEYSKDKKKLANYVYGARKFGGTRENSYQEPNPQPEDGWKYRGRGFNQITFKATYKKIGDMIGVDLVSNPELLINNPVIAGKACIAFFKNKFRLKHAPAGLPSPNDMKSVDEAIKWFAWANAGWKKDPKDAIKKAEYFKQYFS